MLETTFRATRSHTHPHDITLYAKGTNPTTGYHPHFATDLVATVPPRFRFLNPAPIGEQGDIELPFEVSAKYPYPEHDKTVTILNATGGTTVPITKA